jgi:uncharacterized protein
VIERQFQFEWDEGKAAKNVRRHGVSFELAGTIFSDPLLLTVPDLAHSESEERWFSVGCAANGVLVSVAYLWLEPNPEVSKIRLISARKATQAEIRYYQVGP